MKDTPPTVTLIAANDNAGNNQCQIAISKLITLIARSEAGRLAQKRRNANLGPASEKAE